MLNDPTLRSPLQHVSVYVRVCAHEIERGRQESENRRVRDVGIDWSFLFWCSTVMLPLWACVLESHDPLHLNMCVCVEAERELQYSLLISALLPSLHFTLPVSLSLPLL